MLRDIVNKVKEEILKEATGDSSGGRGSYVGPFQPGSKEFDKSALGPFNIPVSEYNDALLAYDSYDGSMDEPKKQIKKIERKAKKESDYLKKHPNLTSSDDDGNNINQTPGYKMTFVPLKEWVEVTDDLVVEDLGVWFGTKKKPKGSSQPKGPWVNICKKVDGHHPPCGRPDASDKSYPKCRAAGVAGKMSDSEKRSACNQKRKAEKTHSKSGTGNSPKMVSYKPRKKQNESLEDVIKNALRNLI
jgi:hypothetical protein